MNFSHDDSLRFMNKALEQARLSSECQRGDKSFPPAVGVVVVDKEGNVLECTYRSAREPNEHAEFIALDRLEGLDLSEATIYSTLEPCIDVRSHNKIDCAMRIVDAGIKEVVVGMLDPDVRVCAKGVKYLQDQGVTVQRFPTHLEEKIEKLNMNFIEASVSRYHDLQKYRAGKQRGPVLSFVENYTPDPISIDLLINEFQRQTKVPEIHFSDLNDELWKRALKERVSIVERLRHRLPGGEFPKSAKSQFDYVNKFISFAWRVRNGAAIRLPQIWHGMEKGFSYIPEFKKLFYKTATIFLTICDYNILAALYRCQPDGPNVLHFRGDEWTPGSESYRNLYFFDEPFRRIYVQCKCKPSKHLRYKDGVIYNWVYAPEKELKKLPARGYNFSIRDYVYRIFVIPQVEFDHIGEEVQFEWHRGAYSEPSIRNDEGEEI